MEIYAGLQWMKKPVDLVNFYPEGEHELVRPQQKYLSVAKRRGLVLLLAEKRLREDSDPAQSRTVQALARH